MEEVITISPREIYCDNFKIELIVEPWHKDFMQKELHKLARAGRILEIAVEYRSQYTDGERQ